MAKKFTETPIPLCGRELQFKRCPLNTLKVYDEKMQDKLKEQAPLDKENRRLEDKEEMLVSRIKSIDKKIDLIDRKDDPTDAEIDSTIKLIDKQEEYFDELNTVRDEIEAFSEEHIDDYKKIQEEYLELMAEKVEAMFEDITAQEFLDTYDTIDFRVILNSSRYYEMCMLGERESKIRKTIQDDIARANDDLESFRRRR